MNKEYLKKHIKLCKKNLKSKRVKCCATCPFQDEIIEEYPEMKGLFHAKNTQLWLSSFVDREMYE